MEVHHFTGVWNYMLKVRVAGAHAGILGRPNIRNRHCERSEAIHSFVARRDGLLRRFAPRNDGRYSIAFSRRIAPEVCWNSCALLDSEGAGNAGCALHPRSHAQCAQKVRA